MKMPAVIFASKEHGMDLQFISSDLMDEAENMKQNFLHYEISEADQCGCIFCRYTTEIGDEYYVLGKITRIPYSHYDQRPTNVFHLFFVPNHKFSEVLKHIYEGECIDFISIVDYDENGLNPEQMLFSKMKRTYMDEYKSYMETLYLNFQMIFESVSESTYVCWDDRSEVSMDEWFFYLLYMFDFTTGCFDNIRVGVKSYYGENSLELSKYTSLVLSKDWNLNPQLPTYYFSQMIFDRPMDSGFDYSKMKDYYLLGAADRKDAVVALKEQFISELQEEEVYMLATEMMKNELFELKTHGGNKKRMRVLKKIIQFMEILLD